MTQIPIINVHESKPVVSGNVITFNIPSYQTIDDIQLRFTNSGAAATAANVKSSIGKVALNINGEQIINTPITRLYDIYAFLGQEVSQVGNPSNVISLNIGKLLFKNPQYEKLFAIGCQNVQTIQLQVYVNSTVTNVTDLEVSTERRNFISSSTSLIKVISYPLYPTELSTFFFNLNQLIDL